RSQTQSKLTTKGGTRRKRLSKKRTRQGLRSRTRQRRQRGQNRSRPFVEATRALPSNQSSSEWQQSRPREELFPVTILVTNSNSVTIIMRITVTFNNASKITQNMALT